MCHDFIRLSSFWHCAPKSLFTDLKAKTMRPLAFTIFLQTTVVPFSFLALFALIQLCRVHDRQKWWWRNNSLISRSTGKNKQNKGSESEMLSMAKFFVKNQVDGLIITHTNFYL